MSTGCYRLRAALKWNSRKVASGTSCGCDQKHCWRSARPSLAVLHTPAPSLDFPKVSGSLGHPCFGRDNQLPRKAVRAAKQQWVDESLRITHTHATFFWSQTSSRAPGFRAKLPVLPNAEKCPQNQQQASSSLQQQI